MRHKYVCKFKVTGNFNFPIDMLRYDRCMPVTEQDANKIQATYYPASMPDVTINLMKYTRTQGKDFNDQITVRRWQSFGWKVSELAIDVTYDKI